MILTPYQSSSDQYTWMYRQIKHMLQDDERKINNFVLLNIRNCDRNGSKLKWTQKYSFSEKVISHHMSVKNEKQLFLCIYSMTGNY